MMKAKAWCIWPLSPDASQSYTYFLNHAMRTQHLLTSVTVLLLLSACAMKQTDHQNQLYLSPKTAFSIEQADNAINQLLAEADSPNAQVVLFIHGRGAGRVKHPQKALEQMLPALESEYDVNVLLFNWAGSGEGGMIRGFPEENARRASQDLFAVINAFSHARQQSSQSFQLAILTHSMGSLVLEETLARYAKQLPQNLAHTVIISAPASSAVQHANWLETSQLGNSHYVLVNHSDKALWWVEKGIRKAKRLGRSTYDERLANNTTYVDLSDAGVNHRYFVNRTARGKLKGQNGNQCIKQFYSQAFTHQPISVTSIFDTDDTTLQTEKMYAINTGNTNGCSDSLPDTDS